MKSELKTDTEFKFFLQRLPEKKKSYTKNKKHTIVSESKEKEMRLCSVS